ncbi:hypothetical protein BaRGS_00023694 [Batillaria attramentaria]|uniref:Uncharacterized protein n=1 Tax=Batillaria attramentaria TaxID=370345 RepID=A0ABD0KD67_9CAEN
MCTEIKSDSSDFFYPPANCLKNCHQLSPNAVHFCVAGVDALTLAKCVHIVIVVLYVNIFGSIWCRRKPMFIGLGSTSEMRRVGKLDAEWRWHKEAELPVGFFKN